ncbi:hypothetical protein Q5752_001667 [Cryptotrichosporon argae]
MSQPHQAAYEQPQAGPSRWVEGGVSGLSAMMRTNGTPPVPSPSSNPHSGFHPSSFGPAFAFVPPSSSPYSSSMAMSISPPRWPGQGQSVGMGGIGGFGSFAGTSAGGGPAGSAGGGAGFASGSFAAAGGFGSGSFVGSVGAFGTSFGRQAEGRERELEAKYVRDFTCCGKQLGGLHELLEHYEEEHANMAPPDVRMLAASGPGGGVGPGATGVSGKARAPFGDAPSTPGMMDFEMDEPLSGGGLTLPGGLGTLGTLAPISIPGGLPGGLPLPSGLGGMPAPSPWAAAFRPQIGAQPACVPPSVLSYTPSPAQPPQRVMTPEAIQAKAARKAARKAEKAARQDGDESEGEGEKRFRCPIDGCGKVYKQANGLKYHLTRSINSGHGNVAAMGGLMAMLDEADK